VKPETTSKWRVGELFASRKFHERDGSKRHGGSRSPLLRPSTEHAGKAIRRGAAELEIA